MLYVLFHRPRLNIQELCEHPASSSSELDIWRSGNPPINSHCVRQLLVAVVRATFRFHDATPQGKWYTTSILGSFLDFKNEGRMMNRFGKVRLNLLVCDGI